MIELGIAIGLRKKTFVFRDDFRKCCPAEDYPLNLMIFSGMPEKEWKDYYFQSLEEIADPKKAFVRWIQGEL